MENTRHFWQYIISFTFSINLSNVNKSFRELFYEIIRSVTNVCFEVKLSK